MTGFTLAALRHKDAARCAELERKLFPDDDPWRERAFRSELDNGHYYLGAYDESGLLVGYAGLAINGRAPDFEGSVQTIAVDSDWQGRGVGRALFEALLARADEVAAPVFLEVRTDNERAIALYRSHGFEQLGLRRRYYQPSGADAYTMGRPAAVRQEETS
ncbi:ribosomal protein S18-alanine N-acetyltransferase [Kutzneria buriramensis]|uniref:Ribosomal-protein-alanine N-acetyltransferase n=1 Tax=Kutzneria buriramensis TaxID=1045776 RepID=A0A3E0IA07_9PSEU|nr:ribosomal protein S18-alanine N-acetyltransferase [Kutzneria buriramensis]REH55558.1 ribosomal-protein-alanine N-acetyltransferase [Kutzneria buriramensis]